MIGALSLIPREKRRRTRDHEQALLAVSAAYHATKKYLDYRRSHERDSQREWDIAMRWHDAATLLQKYDRKIAQRLHIKSRFWHDGATWDDRVVDEAKIGLSTIWREVSVLLQSRD